MSTETQKLVREIEAFLNTTGMAETTFGRKAVNDGKLVSRLRDRGSVTLDKAEQIRGFIVAYWPADVPRPTAPAEEAAACAS